MHLVPGGADVEQQHGAAGGWRQDPQVNSAVLVGLGQCLLFQHPDQVSGGLSARAPRLRPLRDELRARHARAVFPEVLRPGRQVGGNPEGAVSVT